MTEEFYQKLTEREKETVDYMKKIIMEGVPISQLVFAMDYATIVHMV